MNQAVRILCVVALSWFPSPASSSPPAKKPAVKKAAANEPVDTQVTGGDFSPDGKVFLTGGNSRIPIAFDGVTGKRKFALKADPQPHPYGTDAVTFSPDGRLVAVKSAESETGIVVFNLATGRRVSAIPDESNAIPKAGGGLKLSRQANGFAPDSKTYYTLYDPKDDKGNYTKTTIRFWNSSTGKQTAELSGFEKHIGMVRFSPDGSTAATSGYDGFVRIWNVPDGTPRAKLSVGSPVQSVMFSPDGGTVVSVAEDNSYRLWSVADLKEAGRVPVEEKLPHRCWFSPDGKVLLTAGSQEQRLRFWDTATWKSRAVVEGQPFPLDSVHFSPDSATVTVFSSVPGKPKSGIVRLLDAATGRELAAVPGLEERRPTFFNKSPTMFVVNLFDHLEIWDLTTMPASKVATVAGVPGERLWFVSLSPDDEILVTNGAKAELRFLKVKDLLKRK